MVSIGANPYQNAKDYERDNYYIKGGQYEAEISGELAKDLKFTSFNDETHKKLSAGCDRYGRVLVESGVNGKHRPGLDLTFSPHKSVSLAYAFGNETQRKAVETAHNNAVSNILNYIEKNLIEARVTKAGVTQAVKTGNIITAKINHYLSRELDPQLHTHAVIYNITRTENGYRAITDESIYHNKSFIMKMYEAELGRELIKAGYSVSLDKGRFTQINGIDKELQKEFSTRREQIEKGLEEAKRNYPNADEAKHYVVAVLGTRQDKKDVVIEDVYNNWHERREAIGYARDYVEKTLEHGTPNIERGLTAGEYVRRAVEGLTEYHATFTKQEAVEKALELSGFYRFELKTFEREFEKLENVRNLGEYSVMQNYIESVYTTAEVIKAENSIFETAKELQNSRQLITIQYEKGDYWKMTDGQKNALREIMTSKDGITMIQGDAGTGKTFMMKEAKRLAEENGYQVIGVSVVGQAKQNLQNEAGIDASTVTGFLKNTPNLSDKTLLIVEEAGTLGTWQAKELIEIIKENENVRAVFIGDVKQHESISAGRVFAELQKTLPTVEVRDIVRQTKQEMKETVQAISEKDIKTTFQKMEQYEYLEEVKGKDDRYEEIAKEFMKDPYGTAVLTNTNQSKDELNETIRAEMKNAGELGESRNYMVSLNTNFDVIDRQNIERYEQGMKVNFHGTHLRGTTGIITEIDKEAGTFDIKTTKGETKTIDPLEYGQDMTAYRTASREIAEGDKIMFLKNDSKYDLSNGQTATVKDIDGSKIIFETDDKRNVTIDTKNYNNLDYAYAMTNYKSQGLTVDRVIGNLETAKEQGGQTFNSVYVSATRGKEEMKLFTDDKEKLFNQMGIETKKEMAKDYHKSIEEATAKDFKDILHSSIADSIDRHFGKDKDIDKSQDRGFQMGR